jgi:hypothetical protein
MRPYRLHSDSHFSFLGLRAALANRIILLGSDFPKLLNAGQCETLVPCSSNLTNHQLEYYISSLAN